MTNVLVTVPNLHWIHKSVVVVLMKLMGDPRYRLKFDFPSKKPFENNLHHIVQDFIAGDYDFWLSIDDDNPPSRNPLDLVELDKDIIGLPTPIWHFTDTAGERPIYWNGYDYRSANDAYAEHLPREGLQKVDAIGTGCFIIARRVFEHPDLQHGAFVRKLYSDGTVNKGNDLSFCERAREAGFEIYCHYDYPCNHFSEIDLDSIAKAITNMFTESNA